MAAAVAVAACLALTAFSQLALNVDGVSYLDLARVARAGDWHSFVQGYWSPLFPAIIGALSTITGNAPTTLIAASHDLNGAITVGVIALLWWWGHRNPRPYFTPAIIAVFLLASTGLPRIEAVTPDVLLLGMTCWLGYELLHHRDKRPVASGLAMGLSFLAKTSVWPWMLLSIPLRLWGAEGSKERKGVLLSSGIAILIASAWVIPLSIKSGHATLGSAGRLNYAWYIEASDARTPDTHRGQHREARIITVDPTHQVTVYTFEDGDRWTYAPWSDPTAWSDGIISSNASFPRVADLVAYWGRQAGRTFGFWMLPVLLGVLAPFALVYWDRELPRRLLWTRSPRTTTVLLGLAGILQFVAVHAEPRLLAPFVFLLGAAMLEAIFASDRRRSAEVGRGRLAALVAWITVIWLGSTRLSTGVTEAPRNAAAVERILTEQSTSALSSTRSTEVLVAGPAMPFAAAAFIAGVRIVVQIPPASVAVAQSLPPAQQVPLLQKSAGGRAGIIWLTDQSGGVKIVPIPENGPGDR